MRKFLRSKGCTDTDIRDIVVFAAFIAFIILAQGGLT